ncbi:hypothetical protein ACFFIX_23825 [Metabacillus herbersteinensis]|uniref:LXG domain-containing protein n=1 Tax=Metabacillus herbersteinensis TaxID=283816 RepID=A0ABV6GL30_9BACI
MSNAGERALAAATQLEKIGFVDFTVDLVRGVYQVILNGSIEQLKAYAEFVSSVAKTLEDYQAEVIGANGQEELNTKADSYIKEIFQLEPTTSTHALTDDQYNNMMEHFSGVTITTGNESKSFDNLTEKSGTRSITNENLRLLVIAKLKQSAKESYDLIKTILKIGMQKVVVTNGEIFTKLTFHVDTQDTYEKTNNNYNTRSSGWGLGGAVGGSIGKLFGGSLSGGYRSSNLNVSVVNEKSTAASNVNVDVLGSVKIQFRTETFPSIDA